MSDDGEGCRIDVWLWRARFFKTRSLACRFVENGQVRLVRAGGETRLDKASRIIKVGDGLVFAVGGRLVAIRVEQPGDRRGPAGEARTLYSDLPVNATASNPAQQTASIDRIGRSERLNQ